MLFNIRVLRLNYYDLWFGVEIMKARYLCLLIILFMFFGCVQPQQFVALENRVAAMEMDNNRQLAQQRENKQHITYEKELLAIQDRLNTNHIFTKEEYAQLKYDIRSIKKTIQSLQGSIEEMNHRFEQFSQKDRQELEIQLERLDNAISKNYEKVIKIEKHVGFEPSAGVEPEAQNQEDQVGKTDQEIEEQSYASAKKMYDDRDMENARIQFENFITKYPDSNNADNSRFWIADSYYSEKRYAEAILEYQKVLEAYPDSNKLAAARLKQGYAFAELGEYANARLILKELLKKYPDSQEAQYATEKLKSLK